MLSGLTSFLWSDLWQQYKTHQLKLHLDRYDRRLNVYGMHAELKWRSAQFEPAHQKFKKNLNSMELYLTPCDGWTLRLKPRNPAYCYVSSLP